MNCRVEASCETAKGQSEAISGDLSIGANLDPCGEDEKLTQENSKTKNDKNGSRTQPSPSNNSLISPSTSNDAKDEEPQEKEYRPRYSTSRGGYPVKRNEPSQANPSVATDGAVVRPPSPGYPQTPGSEDSASRIPSPNATYPPQPPYFPPYNRQFHPFQSNYNGHNNHQRFVPPDPNLSQKMDPAQNSPLPVRKDGHRREHSAGLDVLSAAAAVGLSNEELASAAGAPAYLPPSRNFHRRGNSNVSVSSLDIQMNLIDEGLPPPRVQHAVFMPPNYPYPYYPGGQHRRVLPNSFNYPEPYPTQYPTQQMHHPNLASPSFENANVDGPNNSQVKYPYPVVNGWEGPGMNAPVSDAAQEKNQRDSNTAKPTTNPGQGHHRKQSSFSYAISKLPVNMPYPRHRVQTSVDSFPVVAWDMGNTPPQVPEHYPQQVVYTPNKDKPPPSILHKPTVNCQEEKSNVPVENPNQIKANINHPLMQTTEPYMNQNSIKRPIDTATGAHMILASRANKRVRRKCSVLDCGNRVVQGGLCISHGARRKTCKYEGCSKNVKKAGLCSTHGPARKRCEFEGCNKVAVQGGKCIAHGARKKLCTAEGCTKQSIISGMCKKHYDLVNGIRDAPKRTRKQDGDEGNSQHRNEEAVVTVDKKSDPALNDKVESSTKNRPGHKRGLSIFSEMKAVDTIINDWK